MKAQYANTTLKQSLRTKPRSFKSFPLYPTTIKPHPVKQQKPIQFYKNINESGKITAGISKVVKTIKTLKNILPLKS